MGQKVHPLGFRLGITQKHQSYWCTKPRVSALWVADAAFLRQSIQKTYRGSGITSIEIKRRDIDSSLSIEITAARPDRFRDTIHQLRDDLVKELKAFYRRRNLPSPNNLALSLFVKPIQKPDTSAAVLAEKLVEELEQRKPHRRAMKQTVQRAIRAGVKGIKIQVSGRLNGTDIARSEDVREGPVPLQTLRADIDYSSKPAKTIFGLLGVKIWVFNREKLTPLANIAISK
jgi:small subunit ribosomal protein S3